MKTIITTLLGLSVPSCGGEIPVSSTGMTRCSSLSGLSIPSLSGLTRQSLAFAALLALAPLSHADMQELADNDLQQATGQEGITISAKLDFATGTRISTQNSGAKASELKDPTNANNWQVIDNITGSIEAKGMKTELLLSYGKDSDGAGVSAAQTTLPEHIVFEDLHSDGLYIGSGANVTRDGAGNASHNFIMGLEIDGTLNFPAQTKITTFVVK